MQAPITTISQLGSHEGQAVTIRGWLYNLRESGKLLFPIIRDGSGLVQGVVVKSKVAPEVWDALKGLTQESALIVTGQVRADKRAPGGYELEVETAEVVQRVPEGDPYPITLKEHGVDFLMEHRHLWMRSPRQAAILRTRAEIINAVREYLEPERIHSDRSAHPHPGRLRGYDHAVSGRLLRRAGVPDAVRPALHRGYGHGARQGLQLRTNLPRGKIQDPSPSHRVLDGRARGRLLPRSTT